MDTGVDVLLSFPLMQIRRRQPRLGFEDGQTDCMHVIGRFGRGRENENYRTARRKIHHNCAFCYLPTKQ